MLFSNLTNRWFLFCGERTRKKLAPKSPIQNTLKSKPHIRRHFRQIVDFLARNLFREPTIFCEKIIAAKLIGEFLNKTKISQLNARFFKQIIVLLFWRLVQRLFWLCLPKRLFELLPFLVLV